MAIIYFNKKEYKIFKKKPSYGVWVGETEKYKSFNYTTNNIKKLKGIVAKKGHQLRYD